MTWLLEQSEIGKLLSRKSSINAVVALVNHLLTYGTVGCVDLLIRKSISKKWLSWKDFRFDYNSEIEFYNHPYYRMLSRIISNDFYSVSTLLKEDVDFMDVNIGGYKDGMTMLLLAAQQKNYQYYSSTTSTGMCVFMLIGTTQRLHCCFCFVLCVLNFR